MSFSEALIEIKKRKKVQRAGWNGKGMWVKLFVAGYVSDEALDRSLGVGPGEAPTALSYLAMKTADNGLVPWLASQTDILAEDWQVVE